jgi:ABC-type Zn uptake system ZnuABC Zn-binding protein ZnuA
MSNKSLEAVARETHTHVGTPLIADGNGTGPAAGFEGMVRNNVTAITQALAAR